MKEVQKYLYHFCKQSILFSFHSYLDIGETKKKPAEVNNEVRCLKSLRTKHALNVSDMPTFMPNFYIYIMFNNNTII